MNLNEVYGLISGKLEGWFKSTVKLLPNIALAAIILVLGFFLAKLLRKIALKMINKISHLETVNKLFSSFVYILGLGITIFTALDILNLDKAVTTALAGAGILGLALAFAFQDIAANFMSGIFLSFRRPFNVGDLVETDGKMGRIESINLRDTTLTTLEGQKLIIPNKNVFQNAIENYSSSGIRRAEIKVGVSYGEDLEKVKLITLKALKNITDRDTNKKIEFYYEEFGDSSINISVRVWLNNAIQSNYLQARSEAIMFIKKAFDENDINIPFPIRTLDFGIKGGEKLSEMPINFNQKPEE